MALQIISITFIDIFYYQMLCLINFQWTLLLSYIPYLSSIISEKEFIHWVIESDCALVKKERSIIKMIPLTNC